MTIPWNYDHDTQAGPANWSRLFPGGQRTRQSPINIIIGGAKLNSTCCHGRIITTNTNLGDELGAHLDHQLHLESSPSSPTPNGRHHLDSVGEDTHASPDSGRRSGSISDNSQRSSSPPARHQQSNYPQESQHSKQRRWRQLDRAMSDQKTRFCTSKRKLFLGYPRYLGLVALENNGHAWQANIPTQISEHTLLSGPPFGDRQYRLAQFHCHWGRDCNSGSEHTINGRSYSAEIHFVHWNCTDFNSFEEASRHGHGLAVLGVFVQALEGEHNRNRHLERISSQLHKIRRAKSSSNVSLGLDIKRLFPGFQRLTQQVFLIFLNLKANRWQYATYEGSLTTPPLSEVVQWLVFLNPIQCNTSQLDEFRQLESGESSKLLTNCRPIQATNGRLVIIWSHH